MIASRDQEAKAEEKAKAQTKTRWRTIQSSWEACSEVSMVRSYWGSAHPLNERSGRLTSQKQSSNVLFNNTLRNLWPAFYATDIVTYHQMILATIA
jgi:hypothetical protein